MRTAGHVRLIGEHPYSDQNVPLAETPPPSASEQHVRPIYQKLCEVVRARDVLEPPFHRHCVGAGGGLWGEGGGAEISFASLTGPLDTPLRCFY